MEQPVNFASCGDVIRGVLHGPEATLHPRAAAVLLHGWDGCRLGPHRMFVRMARRLAGAGLACIRFDFRGRGESGGSTSSTTIASMIADAGCAVDFICERIGDAPVVLIGICSGCKVAMTAAAGDPRIVGVSLWSPQPMGRLRGRDARFRHVSLVAREYARKLLNPDTWRKIFAFRVNVGLVRKAVAGRGGSSDESGIETEHLERFEKYRGAVLLIYGSNDPEGSAVAGPYESFMREAGIRHRIVRVAGANHSFYSTEWEREVLDSTQRWIMEIVG